MADTNYAPEYTPELSQSYLAGSLADIDQFSRVDEGRATAEAASRGLLGQAYEGSAIGASRANAVNMKSKAIGDFNLNVAGMKRDERLGDKNRGFQVEDRNFAATEAEKDRAFRKSMAEMGYMQDDKNNASATEGAIFGGLSSIAAGGIGGYMGGVARRG